MLPYDFPCGYAGEPCSHNIIFILQGQELSAHHPGHTGPVDKGENDGYVQVHLYCGNSRRNCRRKGHPERNLRNGTDYLNDSLNHNIYCSAKVS